MQKHIISLLWMLFVFLPLRGQKVLSRWQAGSEVTMQEVESFGLERCFRADTLSDEVWSRMQGRSYPAGCPIARQDLRYVCVLHRNEEGRVLLGELVCHRHIASDIVSIFRELFRSGYPIERMVLIDEYGADDERSMRANNTTCFCYRAVAGTQKLSKHAQGLAIDINPLYNPYQRGTVVQPATARRYTHRTLSFPYKIVRGDACHRLFLQHGFSWGGAWRSVKDWQHFEK